MTIIVREAKAGDGMMVVPIHRRAIHEVARANYDAETLNAWGPPILPAELPAKAAWFEERFQRGSIVVVAEVDGVVAGFGEIVPAQNMIYAVYVSPDYMRRGVGSALLRELERIAREKSLRWLELNSSLTAEKFYVRNGYVIVGHGFHELGKGRRMACVKMRKELGK